MKRALVAAAMCMLIATACTIGANRYRIAIHACFMVVDMKNKTTSDKDPVQPRPSQDIPNPMDGFLKTYTAQGNRKSYRLMRKAREEIATAEQWAVVRRTLQEAERAVDGGN